MSNVGGLSTSVMFGLAFGRTRGLQGNPTMSILRYTVSGADHSAGIAGTQTQVTGLSDIACTVSDMTKGYADRTGMQWEEGNRIFTYVPATDAQKAQPDGDVIVASIPGESEDLRWRVRAVRVDNTSGACEAVCRREE